MVNAPFLSRAARCLDGTPGRATSGAVRLPEVDGIRGWAALAVVVFHMGYETFGALFPNFRNPLTMAFNGRYAVGIFFILSGEALATSFFAGGGRHAIATLAVRRHSRLSIPILASVLLVYLLQNLGLVFSAQAAVLVHREDWLTRFATEPVTLWHAVRYALATVYAFDRTVGDIIPFLWTMPIELVGSVLVFLLLAIWDQLRCRAAILLVLAIVLITSASTCFWTDFIVGLGIAAARQRGAISALQADRRARLASAAVLLLAVPLLFLCCARDDRLCTLLEIILLGAILVNPAAVRFFASGVSRFLGHISFPLYLVQYAVLISLTSGLIVHFGAHGTLDERAALGIEIVSVVGAIVAALLFEPVEIATRDFGRRLSRLLIAPSPRPGQAPTQDFAHRRVEELVGAQCD